MGLGAGGDLHWVTLLSLTPAGPAWAAHCTDCQPQGRCEQGPWPNQTHTPSKCLPREKGGGSRSWAPCRGWTGERFSRSLPALTHRPLREGAGGGFPEEGLVHCRWLCGSLLDSKCTSGPCEPLGHGHGHG